MNRLLAPLRIFNNDCLELLTPELVAARFTRPKQMLSDADGHGGWFPEALAMANHTMRADAFNTPAERQRYCEALLARHGLPPCASLQLTAAPVAAGGVHQCGIAGAMLSVFITAGVARNAVCAGDPPSYDETGAGEFTPLPPAGTINTAIFVDARLDPHVFPHIFTVVAEAKAGLLRERGVMSCYSPRFATGTGTDSTLVAADPAAARHFTTASTHSRLGAAIANAVRSALAAALDREAAHA